MAAAALAFAIALLGGMIAGLPVGAVVMMVLAAGLAALAMTALAGHVLQGQTGDVGGATQQAAEVAALLGLLIGLSPLPT